MKIRPIESFLYNLVKIKKLSDRRDRRLESLEKASVKNILIISSTAIGDTLMSTPAIRTIRKCFPEAHLVALLNNDNMELFKNNPHIDEIVPYYNGWKKFFAASAKLKKYSFDAAAILHGNEPQATPLAYLTGARFIVKLPNVSRFSFLLSNQIPQLTWADLGHGIRARLRAVSLLGCEADGLEMELSLDKEAREEAKIFLRKNKIETQHTLIGLNPGASTLSRQWFPEKFAALGEMIKKANPDSRIILTGSPQERELCSKIKGLKGKKNERVIIAAGSLSLRGTAALIDRLNVFITGDTGPMHMAYAQKTPVVALYAVSEPEKTGPLSDKNLHRIIKKPKTCEPCVSKKCTYQKCMEQISVDEVFSALNDILEKDGKRVLSGDKK